MQYGIAFTPLVPSIVLWIGLAAIILIGAVLLLGRSRGAAVRVLALALVLLALANPSFTREEREPLSSVAAVVIDKSPSQNFGARTRETAQAQEALVDALKKVKGLEVRVVDAGQADGETDGTKLFGALSSALSDVPVDRVAGAFLITDGRVHDIPANAGAVGFQAPVHALITGRKDERDRRIAISAAPRFGIVGQPQTITYRLDDQGVSGERARITVRRDGEVINERTLSSGQTANVEIDIKHAGPNIVEIEASPLDNELTLVNNRAVVAIDGVRDQLRVLLVSGEPHSGERTWRNLLKSDAGVGLVHFTILRPPEKQDGTPINQLSLIPFPTRELFSERINDFDLIIFDRYQHRGILQIIYYDNIAQYVLKRGGALLIAAGDDYAGRTSLFATPLRTVLPATPTGRVVEQPFRARSTKDGMRHPVTAGLAGASETEPTWGRWLRQVEARVRDKDVRVLLNGVGDSPLLVLDRKGKGRVALMLSDHAWLWARGFDGGGPHTDLLRRLSHWLMKEPELEEERLIATAKGFRITLERRSLNETVPPIVMSAPGGEQATITPEKAGDGVWRASVDVKLPGLYKFQSGEVTAVAHAGIEDAREMSDVVATEERMRPIADATGAGVFWTRGGGLLSSATGVDVPRVSLIANARHLAGSGWMGLKDREAYVTRGVKLTPMFTGLAALSALLMLIALAWWREGR